MRKITKLTPEQEAELPAFRMRYLDIACDGRRANRQKLHDAITDAYALIGKPKPLLLIMPSPASSMLALSAIKHLTGPNAKAQLRDQLWAQLRDQLGAQLGDQLRDQLWAQLRDQLRAQLGAQLRDQLRDQLWAQLRDQLRDQLGAQLGDQLRDQLRDQLWAQLRDQLWDQLRDQLWAQLRDQLRDQLRSKPAWDGNFLWGTQDLFWIAWARFAQKIGVALKPETSQRLDIMERISTECEWWWPYENIVVVSERPEFVKWDDNRRLHAEGGPAVRYSDGYELWSWHGVSVPKGWITEKAITAQDALTWPNMEQRRAACEILGWNVILDRLDASVIDTDSDPQIGELVEVRIPDIGRERFLRVTCGTGRQFALPVPPDMKTALQANAWTYGLDANQYQPEVRT